MADSRLTNISGIGPVLFERSRRARRVSISVRAFKGVRVAVPLRMSFENAVEFVHLKKPWIKKHLETIQLHEAESLALADLSAGIDSAEARKQLTSRLSRLAAEHGFTFNRVSIRRQRTRWGSCSRSGNISLNIKLTLLPEDLVDYVLLHELVHTRIPDHSKRFWAELERHVGNCKAKASRIRKYDLGVI
ncbi:MAG: YgjP-like metallopeptidase domain-containing protein [Chloroflexota bacterium]